LLGGRNAVGWHDAVEFGDGSSGSVPG